MNHSREPCVLVGLRQLRQAYMLLCAAKAGTWRETVFVALEQELLRATPGPTLVTAYRGAAGEWYDTQVDALLTEITRRGLSV